MATMIYNGIKMVSRWCIRCQKYRWHKQAYSVFRCLECGGKS